MTYAKDADRIRVQGGNDARIYYSAAWNSVGNITNGKISYVSDGVEVVFTSGEAMDLPGKTKCNVELALAQTSKAEIEMIDYINGLGVTVPLYFYNGIVDGYYQEIYFPQVKFIGKMELDIKGNTLQMIAMSLSVAPQAALAVVTPSSGLPADAKSHATATPVTGTNKFFVVIETAVA